MTTAEQVIFMVKKMAQSDLRELGGADAQQNTYLFSYITRALKELAHVAYIAKVSDPLNVSSDDYQTFQISGSPITDLYSPLRIMDSNGMEVAKRTSFAAPKGWWKESALSRIHTKGMNGTYTMYYIAYPKDVTATTDVVEFPDAGIMGLCFWVCGIIKESANGYEEAQVMYNRARERLKVAIAANDFGRGKSTVGWAPSLNDVDAIYQG